MDDDSVSNQLEDTLMSNLAADRVIKELDLVENQPLERFDSNASTLRTRMPIAILQRTHTDGNSMQPIRQSGRFFHRTVAAATNLPPKLPPKQKDIPTTFEDLCKFILKHFKSMDYKALVPKDWLTETKHLLKNKTLSIGVFGRHKAGKSTVLNALLHQDILPAAVTNETATLTKIQHNNMKHISAINCPKNCPYCPNWGAEIFGCNNIKWNLQKVNAGIRDSGKKIKHDTVNHNDIVALVPFMSPYSTGDMQVVLMDTPGLSEANELGITDISEHQLMTCSAYIYVISCTQLEDEIDTKTLKAIIERDPEVFIETRMLIVVTRLDEYEARKKTDACETEKRNAEETMSNLETLIASVKSLVQHQFKSFCAVPDECIIPVSAKAALEARKEMNKKGAGQRSKDMKRMLLEFEDKTGREDLTLRELDQYSQVPLLEERISTIHEGAYNIWKHGIIRDCYRYLQMAIKKLTQLEESYRQVEINKTNQWESKNKLWSNYERETEFMIARYQHGSQFHISLETAYDADIESHQPLILKKCQDEFESFKLQIKKQKQHTSREYRDECELFLEEANKSLLSHFEHLKFPKVDKVIIEASFDHGKNCTELENLLADYCGKPSSKTDNLEVPIREKRTGTVTAASLKNLSVKNSAPLELKDLLAHGKSIHYTILDKMKILAQRLFKRIKIEDPEHKLLEKERDTLLEELWTSLIEDSNEYFTNIKGRIVDGYIEKHMSSIRTYEDTLKARYKNEIERMKEQMLEWQSIISKHKATADEIKSHIEISATLQHHITKLSDYKC